jgi:hypothetical protein
MSEQQKTVVIHVPVLTRLEGEGALDLRIEDGRIAELRLRIFEPPRFFEKFLEGHHYSEIPDMVARICGICPVAYQVTAAQALEKLFGVELDPWARAMRRVFYCGNDPEPQPTSICRCAGLFSAAAMRSSWRALRPYAPRAHPGCNELMDLFGARPHLVGSGSAFTAPPVSRDQVGNCALPPEAAADPLDGQHRAPQDIDFFRGDAAPGDYAIGGRSAP